jgi:succinyl-CoA synthetase beta subunit
MNLHEYQAKALLAKYGLPVPRDVLATTPEEAAAAFDFHGGQTAVVKAQVHAVAARREASRWSSRASRPPMWRAR